ncbi:hypothetical protein DIU31_022525 [Mucilaginibacter rubeus]|uniref:Exo-alpha-sialidase n=1 Tax=Mucilaginibacter rubeus TaxID=2027860 RepID=A0A364WQR0_9SPHI|nr:hypothetical protein DIU31_022525 [Mucilaginibacter rubeus]QEM14570.1 hypothetical protein DEO27_027880 [Mucilaginibacter rubeus]QEM20800.1 hypothetical protein DIU38_022760 [Mucilaginibacter gossypii]RAV60249.1 hypothetical protein DIU36_02265 [Mucilaginibacter rubeus]
MRVVFGSEDKIFCATSNDHGKSFSQRVLVARVPDMHLGMSRGPQLSSSANYSVITAMDKSGNIHWFKLSHATGHWKTMGVVNDLTGSAPEGLMSIAADKKDNFYAVWLDNRTGKHNQIYFASLPGKAMKWTKNILAYQSPDQHVCECCKPSIAVQGNNVAIMFRNWLNGSRDLYVTRSLNGGQTFAAAQKLGLDTWKLNGCPMDGGGIVIDPTNTVQTTWQRKGMVYFCQPGQPETFIGNGRSCAIAISGTSSFITYQNSDTVKLMSLQSKKTQVVGNGSFLRSAILPNNKIICVWEQDHMIKFKNI